MIFKMLACWRLAKEYRLPCFDVLLPTGCDCILEGVFAAENVKDENGFTIELVHKDLQYILWMAVPVFGLLSFIARVVWRYKVVYKYLMPTLNPEMGDWERLVFTIIPTAYYIRVWRDKDARSLREAEEARQQSVLSE